MSEHTTAKTPAQPETRKHKWFSTVGELQHPREHEPSAEVAIRKEQQRNTARSINAQAEALQAQSSTKTPAQPETRNPIYGEGLGLRSKHDDAKELKRLGIAYGDAPVTPQHSPLPWYDDADAQGEIYDADGRYVADNLHPDNASLIVRTVNNADKLAALSVKIGNESVAVVNERDALRAHATALAKACRLWHKASLQPEGSKAQADLGNAAALASRAALAAYDASKGGKQ